MSIKEKPKKLRRPTKLCEICNIVDSHSGWAAHLTSKKQQKIDPDQCIKPKTDHLINQKTSAKNVNVY
jgi:hypothetical protein